LWRSGEWLAQAAWSKDLGAVVNSQGIMQSPVIVILSGYIIEDLNLSLGMQPNSVGGIPSPEIT